MARQSMGDMLDRIPSATETKPELQAVTDTKTTTKAAPADDAPKPKKKTPAASRKTEPKAEVSAEQPKYLTLQRKEARFTDDQLDELSRLTRQLNKRRKGAGERLTDNTLIRIAVDLLLGEADKLDGTTEAELRTSVGL